jgi:integrase/recombinase XerD
MLLTAVQTGLRLSEITGLRQQDVSFGAGAHVRCEGKGRKERCTPLAKPAVALLNAWIEEQGREPSKFLFPNARGERLSADAVQHMVAKHVAVARQRCPSLAKKRVTPHVLRYDVCDALRLHSGPLSALRGATIPSRNNLSHANKRRDAALAEGLFWSVLDNSKSFLRDLPPDVGVKD